jgi:hypothetical protein
MKPQQANPIPTGRLAAASGLLVFIFVFTTLFPVSFAKSIVGTEHFFASHYLFEYAAQNHWQFGSDIVDNVGPYGYLHYPATYAGMAYWSKIGWHALICLVFAYTVTFLFAKIPGVVPKAVFLIGATIFPLQVLWPWFSYEVIPRLVLFFVGIYLLTADSEINPLRRTIESLVFGLFLALVTLEKSSNAYYVLLLLALVALHWLLRGLKGSLACLIGSYVLGVMGFWVLAGQNLTGIATFFKSVALYVDAYQDAVVDEETHTKRHLYSGLVLLASTCVLAGYRLFQGRSLQFRAQIPESLRLILLAATFFVSWKHGMIRDVWAHGTFFYAAAVLLIFLLAYPYPNQNSNPASGRIQRLFQGDASGLQASLMVAGLATLMLFLSDYASHIPAIGLQRYEYQNRIRELINWRPTEKKRELDGQFRALQETHALPAPIREMIGKAPVDEFGVSPAVLLLNKLNYRPRPIPMGLLVVTPELNRLNKDFYENPRTAPEFVFLKDFGMRLADAHTFLSLLLNYQVAHKFQNECLLRRRNDPVSWNRSNIQTRNIGFAEWISLEDRNSMFCWMEMDVERTLAGHLKKMLYKSDLLRLDVKRKDGTVLELYVPVSLLRSGILINPAVLPKNQWSRTADGYFSLWQPVTQFRLVMETPKEKETPAKARYFRKTIAMRLGTVVNASTGQPVTVDDNRIRENLRAMASD